MKILVVAAHPDDEVLGCGGTIAKLAKKNDVYVVILGEGVTSRNIAEKEKKDDLDSLRLDAFEANKKLGVKKVFLESLPDNRFDTVPLLNVTKVVERYIDEVSPKVIYTHHSGDLNVDHEITSRAVFTASRPVGNCTVKEILLFEVLSSTEWSKHDASSIFIPNIYVDISKTITLKREAMVCYKRELRMYPHPRSLGGIDILAQKRGLEVGLKSAEAFYLARRIE